MCCRVASRFSIAPRSRTLCAYLRLIANPDDDPAFIRAITTPRRGIGNATLEALGSFAGQAKCRCSRLSIWAGSKRG